MVVLAERWASPKSKRRKPVDEAEKRARQVHLARAREPRRPPGPRPYLSEYLKPSRGWTSLSPPPPPPSPSPCLGDARRDVLPRGRGRYYGPPAGHDYCNSKLARRPGIR